MQPGAEADLDRGVVLAQLAARLAEWGAGGAGALRDDLADCLKDASDADLAALLERVRTTGGAWGYHPPDPLAQRISRRVLERLLLPGSGLEGAGSLAAASERPLLFLGNHLSFVDANVLDLLLARAGADAVCRRLTALVGVKVYSREVRRLASLCFGTIKLPQSASRATGEAVMPPREVARLGVLAIQTARERRRAGDHLLIFVEGARSRTGGLQRALPAVSRYLDEDALLLPVGMAGTERLIPVAEDRVHPARVRVCLGSPVEAGELLALCGGRRSLVMDTVGFLIAATLPPEYQGVYAKEGAAPARARAMAEELSRRA